MAALDFPASPTVNEEYTLNGKTFQWNGVVWNPNNPINLEDLSDVTFTSLANGQIIVAREGGFKNEFPAIRVFESAPQYSYSLDQSFDLTSDNANPIGIWSDGETIWISDNVDAKIYAYDMATKAYDSTKDFNTLAAAGNNNPRGIWSDGITMWVVDNSADKIFAYNLTTKAYDSSKDFNSLSGAGNNNPQDIWGDGITMWVSDLSDNQLYSYNFSNRAYSGANDFPATTLNSAGNGSVKGIWSDGITMWAADNNVDKLFSYNLASKDPVSQNFDTLIDAGNRVPEGIWSNNIYIWVVDNQDNRVYAYTAIAQGESLFTNVVSPSNGELLIYNNGVWKNSTLTVDSSEIDTRINIVVNKSFVDDLDIDADTLDGLDSLHFLDYNNLSNRPTIPSISGLLNESQVDARINAVVDKSFVDGLNINADLLDGQHGSYYRNYNNLTNRPTILSQMDVDGRILQTVNKAYVENFNINAAQLGGQSLAQIRNYNNLTNRPSVPDEEQVEDWVAGLIRGGDNITVTYNDSAGTLTIGGTASGNSNTISPTPPASPSEGDLWVDSDDLDFHVWDSAQWIELSGGGGSGGGTGSGLTQSQVDARVRAVANKAYVDGLGIDYTTLVNATESVQDLMSTTLVAGTNISLVYDDGAGTLTIASTASGGGGSGSTIHVNAPGLTRSAPISATTTGGRVWIRIGTIGGSATTPLNSGEFLAFGLTQSVIDSISLPDANVVIGFNFAGSNLFDLRDLSGTRITAKELIAGEYLVLYQNSTYHLISSPSAGGAGGTFTPSKANLYTAVREIFHPATNAGVTADDTNMELDIAAGGGSDHYNDNEALTFGGSEASPDARFFYDGTNNDFELELESNASNFIITDNGTTRFTFEKDGDFTATRDITAYSDKSLKTNIQSIINPIEKVSKLRGVEFDRIDIDQHQIGLIAQEVEEVIPEVVKTGENGIKSISYGNLVGLLVEAIKTQEMRIRELERWQKNK